MNSNIERYYKESGKVNSGSVIGVIVIVLFVTIGIGWVYGYLSYYWPFPVYSVFMVIGYVSIVGYSMYLSVKLFKIRNQNFVSKLSLILGGTAVYIAWVWFITTDQSHFVWNPITMVQIIREQESLWWGTYVSWVLELVLTLVVMWFSVTSEIVEPFCEPCNKWIKSNNEVNHLEPPNRDILITEVEEHNYDYLKNLRKINDTAHDQTRVKLFNCKSCNESNYLTIEQVYVVIQKNGKPKEDTRHNIVGNLKVKQKDMDMLIQWTKRFVSN